MSATNAKLGRSYFCLLHLSARIPSSNGLWEQATATATATAPPSSLDSSTHLQGQGTPCAILTILEVYVSLQKPTDLSRCRLLSSLKAGNNSLPPFRQISPERNDRKRVSRASDQEKWKVLPAKWGQIFNIWSQYLKMASTFLPFKYSCIFTFFFYSCKILTFINNNQGYITN